MEDKEQILNEIRKLLQKIDSHGENIEHQNQIALEALNEKTKENSPKENKSIIILKIVFRAFIVAVVTFAFGYIIFTLLKKDGVISNETETKNVLIDSVAIKKTAQIKRYENRNKMLTKSIDSLNILFMNEITGAVDKKNAGYGPKAKGIESKIDSLRKERNKID